MGLRQHTTDEIPTTCGEALPSPRQTNAVSTTLPPLSLPRNVAWVFVGNLAQALSRLLLLIGLVQLGGLEAAGLWVMATAISGPIFAGCELGLRNLVICDVRRRFLFQDYFSLRTISAGAALGITALVACGVTSEVRGAILVFVVATGRLFDSLSDICHGVLQREERMDRIGAGLLLRYGLAAVGILGTLWTGGGVLAAAAADALTAALAFWFCNLPGVRQLLAGMDTLPHASHRTDETAWHSPVAKVAPGEPPESSRARAVLSSAGKLRECPALSLPRREWLAMIWESIPAGIIILEINLLTNIPRYIVDAFLGRESLAVFASFLQIAGVGMLFVGALANAVVPRLAKHYHDEKLGDYCRLLGMFTLITLTLGLIPFTLLILPIGRWLIATLFTPEFLEHMTALRWLALAACLLYLSSPLGRAVDALLQFRAHMVIRGVTLLVLVAILPALTVHYGMVGTAIGLTLGLAAAVPLYLWTIIRAWRTALRGSSAEVSSEVPLPQKAAA